MADVAIVQSTASRRRALGVSAIQIHRMRRESASTDEILCARETRDNAQAWGCNGDTRRDDKSDLPVELLTRGGNDAKQVRYGYDE